MAETNLKLQVELPEIFPAVVKLIQGLRAYEETLTAEQQKVLERFIDPGLHDIERAFDGEHAKQEMMR